jgi:hypothetical protein
VEDGSGNDKTVVRWNQQTKVSDTRAGIANGIRPGVFIACILPKKWSSLPDAGTTNGNVKQERNAGNS